MKNIDEIYFCPHTLEFFFRRAEREKKTFNLIYPLEVSIVE